MMENCCYDFFELLTLNMARQGFSEILSMPMLLIFITSQFMKRQKI